ncbi:MAG: hypothetical protein AB7O52_19880 [Planctomycetota bacterium]
MSKRAVVSLLFIVLHGLACLAMAFPYHRDVGTALLVLLFTVACGLWVTLFVVWRRPVWHGVFFAVWAIALLVVFFVGWGDGWFQPVRDEGELAQTGVPEAWFSDGPAPGGASEVGFPPYGEAFARKGIDQPISTLTDLAFISAGFVIVLLASLVTLEIQEGRPGGTTLFPIGSNAAVRWDRPFVWLLGLVVIFMGPASMYLHASFRNWAGWMDSFSVYNLGLFGLSFVVFRLIRALKPGELAPWVFALGLYLILAVTFGLIGSKGEARIYLIAIGLGLWLVAELALAIGLAVGFSGRGYFIAWWWGAAFLVLFAAAGVFKFFVESTGKFDTAWQPHGLFHTLAATALPFGYLYWASERTAKT